MRRPLFLVPSRGEGLRPLRLHEDLGRESCGTDGAGPDLVVVLDGADEEVERTLRAAGVDVLVKEPAGPHKGAALAWAVRRLDQTRPGYLDAHDFVLVFDADTRIPPGWLGALRIPASAEAFQAPVRSAEAPAPGAPRAEALSLAVALLVDDPARDAAGLPVRLRGKAMGFTPAAFREGPGAGAATTAEDSEATLLLLAAGIRVRALAGPEAWEEPAVSPSALAASRARWLGGHLALLARRPGLLLRLLVRRPRAALSLLLDLYLRPRALVWGFLALLALGASAVSLALLARGAPVGLWPLAAAISAGTLALEALHLRRARRILGFSEQLPAVGPADLFAMARVWAAAARDGVARPLTWHRARRDGGAPE